MSIIPVIGGIGLIVWLVVMAYYIYKADPNELTDHDRAMIRLIKQGKEQQ